MKQGEIWENEPESASTKRFFRKTGSVSPTVLGEIKAAIKAVIVAD